MQRRHGQPTEGFWLGQSMPFHENAGRSFDDLARGLSFITSIRKIIGCHLGLPANERQWCAYVLLSKFPAQVAQPEVACELECIRLDAETCEVFADSGNIAGQ